MIRMYEWGMSRKSVPQQATHQHHHSDNDSPIRDRKKSGRLPFRSNSLPPTTIKANLMIPKNIRISVCCNCPVTPDWSRISIKKYWIASIPTACCEMAVPTPTHMMRRKAGVGLKTIFHPNVFSATVSRSIDSWISCTTGSTSKPVIVVWWWWCVWVWSVIHNRQTRQLDQPYYCI